jgi:uncharacterized membrane-anchored protein YhcB (DUF1043 family)
MSLIEVWMMGLGGIIAGVTIGILAVRVKPNVQRSRTAQSATGLAGEVI